MSMSKKYINSLKKTVDKHIKHLDDNSKDMEYILQQLGQINMDEVDPVDKKELDKLINQINEVDNIINKVLGEEQW